MTEEKKPEAKRPVQPVTGAIILLGSIACTAAITWALSKYFPISPEALDRLKFPLTSDGGWLILGAWLIFPWALGLALLRMARGVDPMRLTLAFAGVTYFLQCWAEYVGRGDIVCWPELLFTALPVLVFHKLAQRHAPPEDEDDDSEAPA